MLKVLPGPFEWMPVPGGNVTIEYGTWEGGQAGKYAFEQAGGKWRSYRVTDTKAFTIPDFAIAKYALTNRQFQVFVDARDGYCEVKWWDFLDEAQAWRKQNGKPQDTSFKGDDLPRTNVCWYEAVAFTRWLAARVGAGRALSLPTEQQWQRAAIGDTGGAYPWGRDFDESRVCFNTSSPVGVTVHENGASPYKVIQMSGNVWEWCLTKFEKGGEELSGADVRVLRGGSWNDSRPDPLRADYRVRFNPYDWLNYVGLRCALSY